MTTLPDITAFQNQPPLYGLLQTLIERIEALEQDNARFREENIQLRARLNQNSTNSHKPPSSDGLGKRAIKNNRKKTQKRPGAQPGHAGTTLQAVAHPDEQVLHRHRQCRHCGWSLDEVAVTIEQRRQVFELPPLRLSVTEHLVEGKRCPDCHQLSYAQCRYEQPVQYGERLKALSLYLRQVHYLSYDRTQQFFAELFGVPLSDGVLFEAEQTAHAALEPFEQQVKDHLLASPVLHADETGMRAVGKTHWVHVVSNGAYTFYGFHGKRGSKAHQAQDLLPQYAGTLVHDRYVSYDQHDYRHSLCNAHLLRDLKYVHEEAGKPWAGEMIEVLLAMKRQSETQQPDPVQVKRLVGCYRQVLARGLAEESRLGRLERAPPRKKRGRPKRSTSLRLLEMFRDRQADVLRFLHEPLVPFDNNQAERDVRMVKLKQKVSGCFRSESGGERFCRFRSYVSTCQKQGVAILGAIERALQGQPHLFIPQSG